MVTETGMLQLWCVARDGRRWKLEFNVRETRATHENRHRPGHHQLRPGLHRRARGRGPRLSAPPHLRDAATGRRRAAWSRAARCPPSCFWKTASPSASTPASRARSCPRAWCTRRNPGSPIPTSTAPPRSCPGIRRRPAACSRRSKSRRASSPSSATSGTRRRASRSPSRTSSSPCPRPSTKRRAN